MAKSETATPRGVVKPASSLPCLIVYLKSIIELNSESPQHGEVTDSGLPPDAVAALVTCVAKLNQVHKQQLLEELLKDESPERQEQLLRAYQESAPPSTGDGKPPEVNG